MVEKCSSFKLKPNKNPKTNKKNGSNQLNKSESVLHHFVYFNQSNCIRMAYIYTLQDLLQIINWDWFIFNVIKNTTVNYSEKVFFVYRLKCSFIQILHWNELNENRKRTKTNMAYRLKYFVLAHYYGYPQHRKSNRDNNNFVCFNKIRAPRIRWVDSCNLVAKVRLTQTVYSFVASAAEKKRKKNLL